MDFRDIKEFIHDAAGYIITFIAVFLIVVYVVSFYQIIGPSMNPTLTENDILVINKIAYKISSPKRFEVLEFNHNDKTYVKRVIGLPGEKIEYKDNELYVNNSVVVDNFANITDPFSLKELGYDTIPDNYYLVLGDNRTNSEDSREIGLIPKKEIVGRATIRIWPLSHFGFIK